MCHVPMGGGGEGLNLSFERSCIRYIISAQCEQTSLFVSGGH